MTFNGLPPHTTLSIVIMSCHLQLTVFLVKELVLSVMLTPCLMAENGSNLLSINKKLIQGKGNLQLHTESHCTLQKQFYFLLITQSTSIEVAKERDGDTQTDKL